MENPWRREVWRDSLSEENQEGLVWELRREKQKDVHSFVQWWGIWESETERDTDRENDLKQFWENLFYGMYYDMFVIAPRTFWQNWTFVISALGLMLSLNLVLNIMMLKLSRWITYHTRYCYLLVCSPFACAVRYGKML